MSSLLTLRRVLPSSSLKCASTRRFYSRSPAEELDFQLKKVVESLSPSVVSVASFFCGSDGRKAPHSCRGGNGVFLDPTLIVTSGHVVGRVSSVFESRTHEKSDRFEHGSILYKSYIGSTVALTSRNTILNTRPLAVNFASDVAVLEVVNHGGDFFRQCVLANSPPKDNFLMNVVHEQDFQFTVKLGKVRAVRERTIRAKAPWPMDDEMGWIEHEWLTFGDVHPPSSSTLLNSREKVAGSITRATGSPWFNLYGEVVGISSWEVRDEPAKFLVGFAVPPSCIRSVLDYAKTKGPDDPIVMDPWINTHDIPTD